ncbi:MAG: hypothetical protein P8K77_06325, partial [Polaribacter sp.]|nr:hypothetical protein [Polaribacter sp.]
ISVKGLNGGHSGMDIHKGLGNANKIMNRLFFDGFENFGLGPQGLPRTTIAVTLQQAIDALGIPASAVDCGGVMTFRLALNLTDGRTFSDYNASGSMSGSYFKSPFLYSVGVVANLPSATLYTGVYQLTTVANGIYGVSDYATGLYTIEAISNTQRVLKAVTTFPAFGGFGPVDVQFNLVCGEIIVPGGQSVGAGCTGGNPIQSGPALVNAVYDINNPDDTDFTINFTSDETTSCNGPVQAAIRLVKM